jgi:hypothetical protein
LRSLRIKYTHYTQWNDPNFLESFEYEWKKKGFDFFEIKQESFCAWNYHSSIAKIVLFIDEDVPMLFGHQI